MNNLKQLRKQRGISQKYLANELNVAQNTISQWELGTRDIDSETLKTLVNYFGVSADYLLGNTDNPAPPGAKKSAQDDISLDEVEFALFGEVRELTEDDKEELLRMARRMRELDELKKEKDKDK